ncbi:MAG: type II toxin-antitoxin system VapC family toxin [Kiloniellales bacterium]
MVIDTSAIAAILFAEGDAERYAEVIAGDQIRLVSAGTVLECSLVVEGELGEEGGRELDLLVLRAGIETIAFSADQLSIARHAFRTFGKGRHPAGLNYGDCFSYALSKSSGEPLLFKGADFSKTDVRPVLF